MEYVTTNECSPDRVTGAAANPSTSWHLAVHLECFWPSRRVDEFDGLCPLR